MSLRFLTHLLRLRSRCYFFYGGSLASVMSYDNSETGLVRGGNNHEQEHKSKSKTTSSPPASSKALVGYGPADGRGRDTSNRTTTTTTTGLSRFANGREVHALL